MVSIGVVNETKVTNGTWYFLLVCSGRMCLKPGANSDDGHRTV